MTALETVLCEMLHVLEGLQGLAYPQYDIIVFGRTVDEHDRNMKLVPHCCKRQG